jgi:hypothetical protein
MPDGMASAEFQGFTEDDDAKANAAKSLLANALSTVTLG